MENKIILTNDGSHSIFNPKINECYHSKHGSIVEAEHVFIKNGFSALKKDNLFILEVGFGTGLNTLLTYQKAEKRSINVKYHCIELYPVKKKNYMQLNFAELIGINKEILLSIHESEWETEHKIGRYFKLKKNLISLEKYTTSQKFDVIYFDAFSPKKQPDLWSRDIFKKMFYLLKNNGILVTYCAKGEVKRTMSEVGFKINVLDGPPGKRQMTRGRKSIIEK